MHYKWFNKHLKVQNNQSIAIAMNMDIAIAIFQNSLATETSLAEI